MNYRVKFILVILLLSFLPASTSTTTAASSLPGLSVSGIEIVANGQPVRLHGVNMGDPFWARNPDWYNYSPADYHALSNAWRANVVRISIFPTQWKNMDHTTLLSGLSQEINAALDNGMYVIISYHVIGWPDGFYQQANPGNPADTYDSSMSVAISFWSVMAQTYGSDTRIIFDLWNEPVHPDDFTLYGSDPNPLWPILKGYYESLIQTVRNNGAQNIVIATGNRWASWLVGIKDNPLTDPNVVYAYHKYAIDGLDTPSEWDKDTGGLIGIKPVVVSEWGYEDTDAGANRTWPGSQASYGDPFIQWMEEHNLSNLAWMYHYDWTPALLKSDGSLTLYGSFVKNYLSSSDLIPLDPAKLSFQEIASGLTKPVFITHAGDGSGRLFVVEQLGHIRIRKNGVLLATPFLDIQSLIKSTSSEQGLLALAFDPAYAANGNFYVVYTAPRNGDSTGSNLVLEKFSVSANNPDVANLDSGVILLTISHPGRSNHNGGSLAFGRDGYLYWSTGDGGGAGDPDENAQDLTSLLGKILRIDVHSGSPYGIPASNPFYSDIDPNVKKEIWAYGLRNPWRFSFDRSTHDLYIGDVGQSNREEVDFQSADSAGGENYGWRVMEGSLCYPPSQSGCDQSGKILPVAEYDHTLGCSITGGYVYRGSNFPSLYGYYFYGDYCRGRLFSLYKDPVLGWNPVQLLDTPYSISTFGEDQQGELYLADFGTGKIYSIQYQEAPIVISSVRANANSTGATNVNFTVTFSQNVTGVDAGDFSLTTSGVSGPTLSGVSGTGSVYIVTANTGSGSGTIKLNVLDNDSILNGFAIPLGGIGAGNGNYTSGETYTITKTWIFGDVPNSYWAWTFIERLYSAGITSGCSVIPLNYCPETEVTRAQMAVFLLRGIHGSSYSPPVVGASTGFGDVPTNYWAAAWIKQLAAEGITAGCGSGNYCPEVTATRAQMAVFLLRAKHGSAYSPPNATGIFTDVPVGYWADRWIEQLAAEAITGGCGTDIYCPETPVTRAQMAVFLVKTFNLP